MNPDENTKIGPGFHALVKEIKRYFGPQTWHADVTLYRKFIEKHDAILEVPELTKCNQEAARLRQDGNRAYLNRSYKEALVKYNESICFAETDSDHLGMGYANRSAVYFEQGEYEFALADIALAKKHHYPEKLVPKLLTREKNCRAKLDAGESKGTVPCPRMDMNVNVNPKIPFVADGIAMKVYPECGRGLVAKKDFRAGDIIVDEKPVLVSTGLDSKFTNCSHCSAEYNYNLIPCPDCVSYMYCSEECLENDKRFSHRFECGVAEKLRNIMVTSSIIGPKQFFYGLTLFQDNLQEMMTYCNGESAKGVGDPFELDYREKDLLEEFKILQKAGVHHITEVDAMYRFSAAAYYVVFMKHPLVKQIVTTKSQRNFMLDTFLKYIRNCSALILDLRDSLTGRSISTMTMVASICNHSCDPNAVFTIVSGRVKVALLRPVRNGEQIMVTYGPTWWEPNPSYESTYTCRCVVCTGGQKWCVKENTLPPTALKHVVLITNMIGSPGVNHADRLKMVQQFVNRYADLHTDVGYGAGLKAYRMLLLYLITLAQDKLARARALASLQ